MARHSESALGGAAPRIPTSRRKQEPPRRLLCKGRDVWGGQRESSDYLVGSGAEPAAQHCQRAFPGVKEEATLAAAAAANTAAVSTTTPAVTTVAAAVAGRQLETERAHVAVLCRHRRPSAEKVQLRAALEHRCVSRPLRPLRRLSRTIRPRRPLHLRLRLCRPTLAARACTLPRRGLGSRGGQRTQLRLPRTLRLEQRRRQRAQLRAQRLEGADLGAELGGGEGDLRHEASPSRPRNVCPRRRHGTEM